jgi:hypothetical protein
MTEQETADIQSLVNCEDISQVLKSRLALVESDVVRNALLDIAITAAAASRLKWIEAQSAEVRALAEALRRPYEAADLNRKIQFLQR